MRRSLTLTVGAALSMLLLAMLVPMVVLLRDYVLEDRLAQAALGVQATETVVSNSDPGSVSVYLERLNDGESTLTSVIYPGSGIGVVGPDPGPDEAARIIDARNTGTARVDDVDGGSVLLVPVSLGVGGGPEDDPVVRIFVPTPGLDGVLVRNGAILLALGLALLAGGLLLADRLGRSFVGPIRELAGYAQALGTTPLDAPPAAGPSEVRDLGLALHRLVDRVEVLLERERAGIADLSHRLRTPMTALRLRLEQLDDPDERARLSAHLDDLQATVDGVVREARRSEREGLVGVVDGLEVLRTRAAYWEPLAEDQGRRFELRVETEGPVVVRAGAEDLVALIDVLLDNVFSHTPEPAAIRVTLVGRVEGGLRLLVEDAGPGLPDDGPVDRVVDRGFSGGGSTGLGLSIADKTATEAGGGLSWGRSDLGGAAVVVDLGPG